MNEKLKHFAERLKKLLEEPLPGEIAQRKMAPTTRHLFPGTPSAPPRNSSVLILFYPHQDQITTVFIKRAVYNGVHSGQLAFPGGKASDGESILETALREAQEEMNIPSAQVEILGQLSMLHIPVSQMNVFPVIGICANRPNFIPDTREVQEWIEIPIPFLLDEANISEFYLEKYQVQVPCYQLENDCIWGATAMIVSEMTEILKKLFRQ